MFYLEEEIFNCIMVCSTVLASSCYSYAISKRVPQQPTFRFFLFLPVLSLFFLLPLTLTSVNVLIPFFFFITWLASFKILLLVFNTGPLSNPSLPLSHFVVISCLPLTFQQPTNPKCSYNKTNRNASNLTRINNAFPDIVLRSLPHFAKRVLIMILLIHVVFNKHKLPRVVFLLLVCIFLYIASMVILDIAAIIGQLLLGKEFQVKDPFDEPYMCSSLQDFWGQRWNSAASVILRSTIFSPILHHSLPFLGRKWAALAALMTTFLVSGLMHGLLFYYVGRTRFGWSIPLFFVFQGICVALENELKRRIKGGWEVPQAIMGPSLFVFQACTFVWLILSEFLEVKADDRALEEYAAIGNFVEDLVLAFVEMGYSLVKMDPSLLKHV